MVFVLNQTKLADKYRSVLSTDTINTYTLLSSRWQRYSYAIFCLRCWSISSALRCPAYCCVGGWMLGPPETGGGLSKIVAVKQESTALKCEKAQLQFICHLNTHATQQNHYLHWFNSKPKCQSCVIIFTSSKAKQCPGFSKTSHLSPVFTVLGKTGSWTQTFMRNRSCHSQSQTVSCNKCNGVIYTSTLNFMPGFTICTIGSHQ